MANRPRFASQRPGSVSGFVRFAFRDRGHTTVSTILLLLLASAAEAVGVLALFPAVAEVLQPGATETSPVVSLLKQLIAAAGLTPGLQTLFAVVMSGVLLKGLLTWLAMRRVGHMVADIATDLRLMLLDRLFRARWDLFVSEPTGRFASAMDQEAALAATAYEKACHAISRALQVAMYTTLVFLVSWRLALITLLAGGLIVLSLSHLVRLGRYAGGARKDANRALISKLLDTIHGIKTIRAMASERYFMRRLRDDAQKVNVALKRQADAFEGLEAAQEPFLVAGIVLGLTFATRILQEEPVVVAVLGFVLFRLALQFRLCLSEYQFFTSTLPAFWSVRQTIQVAGEHEEQPLGELKPPRIERDVRIEGVDFSYGDTVVLRGLSACIPARQMTVIIGASGAGKSTLLDLLMAVRRPAHGEIFIDDVPLSKLRLAEWRQSIGYVPQDPRLIHDTVFGNVVLGDTSMIEAHVRSALDAAGALDFVEKLPNGLYTDVGEHGSRLSGGECQRVAIARALIRKPALLMLDEITANLNAETARELIRTLLALRREMTVLAVTHESQLIRAADLVYEISKGEARRCN